jgi:hypothetical protein
VRCFWETLKSLFMALHKLGFIIDQYGWKSEMHTYYLWESYLSNFIKICGTVSRMYGKVQLWLYVNQTSLWISIAENQTCHSTFGKSSPYFILRKSA